MTKSEAGSLDSTGPNPFSDRPSTARTNTQNKAYMDTAMEELDRESNCPEGVPPQIWERLCMYRRQKVEYETQVCPDFEKNDFFMHTGKDFLQLF